MAVKYTWFVVVVICVHKIIYQESQLFRSYRILIGFTIHRLEYLSVFVVVTKNVMKIGDL